MIPTVPSSLPLQSPVPNPVMGDRSRAVVKLARERKLSRDEARLLVLIAAYRDAGYASPPFHALARRLGYDMKAAPKRQEAANALNTILRSLIARKMLFVRWKAGENLRNIYVLTCLGERFQLPPRREAA